MKQYLILFFSLFFSGHTFGQQTSLSTFVPKGWSILDTSRGDLNQDGIKDYIMILRNDLEIETKTDTVFLRPVLILHGQKNGKLVLIAKNDNVALCYHCGGVFGDPYSGITIKNNFFSIEHYGGSADKWNRIITFKYDLKTKTYLLHKDGGESYNMGEYDKKQDFFYNKKNWDKQNFKDYDVDVN